MSENHYNKNYFRWQRTMGAFGGKANLFMYEKHISPDDTILDFGCGGGFLLDNISAKRKIGIEINPEAAKIAEEKGIEILSDVSDLQDNSVDTVISNHALEHLENPYEMLKQLLPKLKDNGKAVFVVPHHTPDEKWKDRDKNMHLYSWNPMTLGNLFKKAGYKIESVENIRHQWPKKYQRIRKKYGPKIFDIICFLTALKNNNYQVKIVATKN